MRLPWFVDQAAAGELDTALTEFQRTQEERWDRMNKLAKMDMSGFTTRALFIGLTGAKELGLPADFFTGSKDYVVYVGYDPKTGKRALYVGMTGDFKRRQQAWKGIYDIKEKYTGLTKKQARSVEQVIKSANREFENVNDPISGRHKWRSKAIEWAKSFLKGKRKRFR